MKTIEHGSGVYSFEIEDGDLNSEEGVTVDDLKSEGASQDFIDLVGPHLRTRKSDSS